MKLKELLAELKREEPITASLAVEIKHNAEKLGQDITRSFLLLQKVVGAHESEIRERWIKMRGFQRRNILLKAWPGMAEKHRPDSEMADKIAGEWLYGPGEPLPQGPIFWPYVNLEDLQQTQPLLAFLNARARNIPWTFALSELSFCAPLAKIPKCLECNGQSFHMKILFCKDVQSGVYGEVVEVDKEYAKESHMNADSFDFCVRPGLEVLRVQQRILKFLVNCSKAILQDKTFEQFANSELKAEPPAFLPEMGRKYATFADTLQLSPYRPRGEVDFSHLLKYVSATFNNAKDHARSLREDPSYLADTIADVNAHRVEWIKDEKGKADPITKTVVFGKMVLKDVIAEAYLILAFWDRLFETLDSLSKQFGRGSRLSDNDLHENFHSVMKVKFYARNIEILSEMLRRYSWGAPGMPEWYRRLGEGEDTYITKYSKGTTLSDQIDHWLDAFDERKGDIRHSILCVGIDMLDKLIKNNKAAQKMISPTVSGILTSISIAAECLRQVDLWLETPQLHLFRESHTNCTAAFGDMDFQGYLDWNSSVQPDLPIPIEHISGKKLDYPAHKHPSQKNIQKMRDAEESLDLLWSEIDSASVPILIQRHLEGPMHRTLPWVPETNAEKVRNGSNEIYTPLSRLEHDEAKEIAGAFRKTSIAQKSKEKTRGNTDFNEDVNEQEYSTLKKLNALFRYIFSWTTVRTSSSELSSACMTRTQATCRRLSSGINFYMR
jgi:hypothetical protein